MVWKLGEAVGKGAVSEADFTNALNAYPEGSEERLWVRETKYVRELRAAP